jgi:5-methylcytosine-specific restriction enzyme A
MPGSAKCETHAAQVRAELDARRGSAASRGYNHAWRKFRAAYLGRHPLCRACQDGGRITEAREVDHIVPLKLAPDRKYDETNLQALCTPCHSAKTASEDGGFGKARA